MRTTASIVLCLLLTHLLLPMVPVSANLIAAGQTDTISDKVVAWEQKSDGKILMVTGSGMLSVNSFEAGAHSEVWSLDLNKPIPGLVGASKGFFSPACIYTNL